MDRSPKGSGVILEPASGSRLSAKQLVIPRKPFPLEWQSRELAMPAMSSAASLCEVVFALQDRRHVEGTTVCGKRDDRPAGELCGCGAREAVAHKHPKRVGHVVGRVASGHRTATKRNFVVPSHHPIVGGPRATLANGETQIEIRRGGCQLREADRGRPLKPLGRLRVQALPVADQGTEDVRLVSAPLAAVEVGADEVTCVEELS